MRATPLGVTSLARGTLRAKVNQGGRNTPWRNFIFLNMVCVPLFQKKYFISNISILLSFNQQQRNWHIVSLTITPPPKKKNKL